MVCRLAAPVCEVRLNAELCERFIGSEDMRLLSPASERIDVGMLQQQQQVREFAGDYLSVQATLQVVGGLVV